jgi:hypothetical protein
MKDAIRTHGPMILPWLAHKAGIDEPRAEKLWAAALHHAESRCGAKETPDYWQVAMDRLLELVAAESLREDAASFGWRPWARAQARLWDAPLGALDEFALVAGRIWRNLGQHRPWPC